MRPLPLILAAALVVASAGTPVAQDAGASPPASELDVGRAVAALDEVVGDAMALTGVPGIAVAVVHGDEVVFARGFGVRQAGRPEPVDAETVFQLASVSKPITSTVVAAVVGRGLIDWDEPVRSHIPAFALSDPYVTANVTVADLLSHRSGLRTSAGDLLEDLGYDRATILSRLDQQPLEAFRSSYNYSNFGYTAGAEAAAAAAGTGWAELARSALFEPLGMTRSSFRHADFIAHENRARLHVRRGIAADRRWAAEHDRVPDAQAPAGGASASIADVARFMRLQLGGGTFEGREVVDAAALAATHAPHKMTRSPGPGSGRAGFYGFGWNVNYDDRGRLEIGHSGAFYLGASTYVHLIPADRLGIAVLTNGEPIGVPEAVARSFLDIAQHGTRSTDWFAMFGAAFDAMRAEEEAPFDYGPPPADARPPRASADYAGRYENPYYGPADVVDADGHLSLEMGPEDARGTWSLSHHDGDTFTFRPVGENAVPAAGVTFLRDQSGAVSRAVIGFYDRNGLGSFARAAPR